MKHALYTLSLLLTMISMSACGGKDDNPRPGNSYPKKVNIEYRVSSTNVNKLNVSYTNETGGRTSEDNVTLPYSKKLERTVNYADNATLSVLLAAGGNAKLEILVNNAVVVTQTFSDPQVLTGTVPHVFQ